MLACAALLLGPGAALALDNILVQTDRATVLKLLPKTTTVIVGNPSIADISLQKNGSVVVTGKSYGTTNLILQDASGEVLGEQLISVQAASDGGQVLVQRGMERETYSCTPRCQPDPEPRRPAEALREHRRPGQRPQPAREVAPARSSSTPGRIIKRFSDNLT